MTCSKCPNPIGRGSKTGMCRKCWVKASTGQHKSAYARQEKVKFKPTEGFDYKQTCLYCKRIFYTNNKWSKYCSAAHRRANLGAANSVNNKTYTANVRGF